MNDRTNQPEYLGVLSQAPAERVKAFAEALIPRLGEIRVLQNRTGLVMLPYSDSVKKTTFHLGEVLVAEARVAACGAEGYGACLGRDLERALAVAILDAAMQGGAEREAIAAFVDEEGRKLAEAEEALLKQVEATRVEMETF